MQPIRARIMDGVAGGGCMNVVKGSCEIRRRVNVRKPYLSRIKMAEKIEDEDDDWELLVKKSFYDLQRHQMEVTGIAATMEVSQHINTVVQKYGVGSGWAGLVFRTKGYSGAALRGSKTIKVSTQFVVSVISEVAFVCRVPYLTRSLRTFYNSIKRSGALGAMLLREKEYLRR